MQRSPGTGVRGAASSSISSSSYTWRSCLQTFSGDLGITFLPIIEVLVSLKQPEKPTPPKVLLLPGPAAEHLLPVGRAEMT